MNLNWQNDREYLMLVEDLLDHSQVKRLETFVHHHVTNRLAHCISVSYLSYQWAFRLGLDERAAARAALLHDLFFYKSEDKHKVRGRGHNYEHPRIALKNAELITRLSHVERDIIIKHMCGATFDIPKYPESWIVTLMDKQSAIMEVTVGYKRIAAERVYESTKKLITQFGPAELKAAKFRSTVPK